MKTLHARRLRIHGSFYSTCPKWALDLVHVAFKIIVFEETGSNDEQQIANTLFLIALDEIDSASLIALSFNWSTHCVAGYLMAWRCWERLLYSMP